MSIKHRTADEATAIAIYKDMSKLCYDITKGLMLTNLVGYLSSKLTDEVVIMFQVLAFGFMFSAWALTSAAVNIETIGLENNDD